MKEATQLDILKEAGILLVDDEVMLLDLLELILKQAGVKNIYKATDGMQALKLLQRHSDEIDVVSLDYCMAEMSGIKVAEIVATTHDRIVGLVMITGFGSDGLIKEFFSTSTNIAIAQEFVNKPFDTNSIIKTFADAVRDVYLKREKQVDVGLSIALKQIKSALVSNVVELSEIKTDIWKLGQKIEKIEFQINEIKNTNKVSGDANYVWALTFLFVLVTGGLAWASFYIPILTVLALASVTIVVLMLISVFDLSKGGKLSEKSLMEVIRLAFSFISRKKK